MKIKEQIDKKVKCGEEDRQELMKELRYNKSENLANYFFLARASEEKLQQRADKVETTDKERERLRKSLWQFWDKDLRNTTLLSWDRI